MARHIIGGDRTWNQPPGPIHQSPVGIRSLAAGIGRLGLCALCPWLVPGSNALADVKTTESGTVQYQYNSNLYDLPSSTPVKVRGDGFVAYGGEVQVSDNWRRQNFTLDLTGTEVRYDRLREFNHTEYKIDAGWDWKTGSSLDGKLEVSRTRSALGFLQLPPGQQVQTHLPLETSQRESGLVGFLINPDWRLEGNGYHQVLDEPLDATPNLRLTESFGQVAVKYIGRARLTSGLSAGYLTGDYIGAALGTNPSYRQEILNFVADYQPSARTGLTGEVGYSRRTSANGTNDVAGITGEIAYRNQLTGKTSVGVFLRRLINSYVANSGSEIDTNATLDVNWQATYKLGVSLDYTYSYSELPQQGLTLGTNRIDHVQFASLKIDYELFRWLSIRPYANIQTRRSNIPIGNFNASVYGIYVTVKTFNK